jgi:hypothetical protein
MLRSTRVDPLLLAQSLPDCSFATRTRTSELLGTAKTPVQFEASLPNLFERSYPQNVTSSGRSKPPELLDFY